MQTKRQNRAHRHYRTFDRSLNHNAQAVTPLAFMQNVNPIPFLTYHRYMEQSDALLYLDR